MLSIKGEAKILGLKPEILIGLRIVESIKEKYGYEAIITEGTGAQHKFESLHYKGLAVDLRSKHIVNPTIKSRVLFEAQRALGDDFDFILENVGEDNEHFHLEFDPK